MKRNIIVFTLILLVFSAIIQLVPSISYASNYGLGNVINGANNFTNVHGANGANWAGNAPQELAGGLGGVLISLGVLIAIIATAVSGIQFMMGGAEEKAKIKTRLTLLLVGMIVLMGSVQIWKIFVDMMSKIKF